MCSSDLSWLQYLEQLGLNGCLADDMGLGKTVQVIARMVQEREPEKKGRRKTAVKEIKLPPTLLIAPTSDRKSTRLNSSH